MPRPALKLADDTTRKPPRRFAFTKAEIEKLAPPAKGRLHAYDTRQAGLALVVTAAGHKSFILYRWSSGKPTKLKIANYGDISIPQARDRVKELTGEIAKGEDPAAQRRQQRDERAHIQTMQGAWEHYRDHHLAVNCSPVTKRNDQYFWKAVPLKTRRLDSITTTDIRRLHDKLSDTPAWANKVVQLIRRIVNHAIDELGFEGENPVKLRQARTRRGRRQGRGQAVSLAQEQSRRRYLEASEAPAFFAAIAAEPDQGFADFARLLIFTGARRSNVQAMAWADMDWTRKTWTIPATQAKAGEAITIPLSSYAVKLLKRRHDAADDGARYVLPARRRDSATGHMVDPKRRWKTLCERAGIIDLTMHDVRRTVGSWANMNAVPHAVVKAMLGHTEGADPTMIYARTDAETVRKAFETTTAAMLAEATAEKE